MLYMVGLGPCVGKEGVVSTDLKIENSLLQEFSRKKLIKKRIMRGRILMSTGRRLGKKITATGTSIQVREGGYPFRIPTWLPTLGRRWVAIVGPVGWQLMDRTVGFLYLLLIMPEGN
jgi:hypothetical protein